MRRRGRRSDSVDRLRENYNLLTDLVRNPRKIGYIAIIRKMKGKSKIPFNINLFDFKKEIDDEIDDINRKILKEIGLGRLPDGLKD